jgi:hypothetical protein
MAYRDESHYDVAQICNNGHVTNSMAHDFPNSNQSFCDRCGAPTIMNCPECGTSIRGYYHVPGFIGGSRYSPPAYCFNCGKSFPWTGVALTAARELANILDALTEDERAELQESIAHLVRETPGTPVAETKFKRLIKKAGKDAYEGMKSILTDVVSEAVKKTIFPS